ncbi:MAG TPA: wax ester/triacylglycerol synthase domain-containing protein [Conexibacter sp.]|nr:wax ester/triacylglycerol synthase domain-containing protein [Conexibacter sp.]
MGAAPPSIPLAHEDRAILELESATIVGHTCKVVVLGAQAPDVDALRASISERLAHTPLLTRRLGGTPDAPAWVADDAFDAAHHVVADRAGAPLDAAGLRGAVARLFAQRLDRARPLWRIDALPLADGGAALVWRIHHALADGTAAMRYAKALLWDAADPAGDAAATGSAPVAAAPGSTPVAGPPGSGPPPTAAPRHAQVVHAADDARRRAHLARFLARELPHAGPHSPFDGRVGTTREVAFATVPLAPLHDAAKALAGATLNDAVLTVVGGGLRRWLEQHHGRLGRVRVKVPVSLHHAGDDAGNRDSFFAVTVPLGEEDPAARLRDVHAATQVRKEDHDAETLDALLRELARVSPRLERFVERVEAGPRAFALNVSNVPGPREPVAVLGAPVLAMHSLAEIGERHALRVAVVSLAGTLCFGLCADPAIVHDVETIASGTEAEAAALIAAASR